MNKLDRILEIAGAALNEASLQLVEDLYRFDWILFLRAMLFVDDEVLARQANELLVIFNNFTSRLAVLPARVVAFMAAESLAMPKKLSQRVVRADRALQFTLKEVMDTGFELASGRFVPLYDVFKELKRWALTLQVVKSLDAIAALKLAKGAILGIIVAIIRIVWAVFVSIATALLILTLVHKWRQLSHEKTILANVLPNDSKRVTLLLTEPQTVRVNLREGPDT